MKRYSLEYRYGKEDWTRVFLNFKQFKSKKKIVKYFKKTKRGSKIYRSYLEGKVFIRVVKTKTTKSYSELKLF